MKCQTEVSRFLLSVALLVLTGGISSLAQDGKLVFKVTPQQAFVFADGRAISESSKIFVLKLSAGEHKIELVNYGYAPLTQTVTITAGKTALLRATLTPVGGTVPGPFGAMTIEGADHQAILLNGKTTAFFVGHGDEFDNEGIYNQELVVPPGTYQVTVLSGDKEVWSGPVAVEANKRTLVEVPKGVRKTFPWKRGEKIASIPTPRFTVGSASALVAVAKPTAELSATVAQVNCGDASQLKWTSSDAPRVEITPVGAVANSGQQSVQPMQTTTYDLTAVGPGGTATATTTVNVNKTIQANLGLSSAEVHYKRVGDKVVVDDSTALNWTASNASTVSIEPLGTVSPTGSRTLQIVPKKNDLGPIDETVTYTLNASNGCGGADTKTATLHIVGSIEQPEIKLSRSVYFQTDRPRSLKSEDALLESEKETLKAIAASFTQYLADQPDARLVLAGHADKRGVEAYNQPLSERRAALAKQFLVQQGISEDKIETQHYGAEQNLSADQVKQLVQQDASLSPEEREKALQKLQTIVYAYNRRVDIISKPTGQESAREYPFNSQDFASLIDRNGPTKPNGVEMAAEKEKINQ
jgi:outer membrane protein OmpA-like peptidoglycan-associated protein